MAVRTKETFFFFKSLLACRISQAAEEEVSGEGRTWRAVIGRAMKWKWKAVTNYCRLRGGKGIGRWCPKCGEKEQTPDHIVFRCGKVRRVRDERRTGRREWASENGMRWDSWDALASKKWLRMEESGRVDNKGRPPILERVDLMGVHRQI